MKSNYYDILDVDKNASKDDIKKAFKKKAKKCHPDSGGDAESFKALVVAYDILSDARKRKMYDEGKDINDTTIDMSYKRQAYDMVLQDFINVLMDDKLKHKNIVKHLRNKYSGAHNNAKAYLRGIKDKKKDVAKRLEGIETKKRDEYNLVDMANIAIMKNIKEDMLRVIRDIRILNQSRLLLKNYKDTFVEHDNYGNFFNSSTFTFTTTM